MPVKAGVIRWSSADFRRTSQLPVRFFFRDKRSLSSSRETGTALYRAYPCSSRSPEVHSLPHSPAPRDCSLQFESLPCPHLPLRCPTTRIILPHSSASQSSIRDDILPSSLPSNHSSRPQPPRIPPASILSPNPLSPQLAADPSCPSSQPNNQATSSTRSNRLMDRVTICGKIIGTTTISRMTLPSSLGGWSSPV
jgi:hypothetical protein